MRLAIIRQHYTADGKVERILESALEALLERNVAISLYTRDWPVTRLKLIEPVLCNPFHVGKLWRDYGFARAIGTVIAAAHADLVESHECLACCDVYRADQGVHAAWFEERQESASMQERLRLAFSPHERYLLAAERRMFASPWLRAVICGSNMVRAEIRDRFGLPDAKLLVIHNPVDSDAYSPALRAHRRSLRERHHVSEAATVYFVAGADFDRSGAATAIAALALLPSSTHLIIAAGRTDAAPVRALTQAQGLVGRVTLVDSGSDLRPYYGAADAFVLPATYDPSPLAALEAMACALPVVVSTRSGAAELVVEHDAGFTCPAADVAELAARMRTLLDPTIRATLGANGRNAVRPFSPSAIALQLVLLYRDLFATSAASQPASATA